MQDKPDKTKKIYLAGVAFISVITFLISLTIFATGVVNLANPSDNIYPRTLVDYKERFVKWDNDTGERIGYQYSEEEMKTMFEEERRIERSVQKTRSINQVVVSGLVLALSCFLWVSHWHKLKKDGS